MKRQGKGGPKTDGKTIPIPASVLTKPAEKTSGEKSTSEGQKKDNS